MEADEEIVATTRLHSGFETRKIVTRPEFSEPVASDAKSLLIGLHSLKQGRRLRVRFGPEEEKLLSVLSAAKLPMYQGPAWHRTMYSEVRVGSWIWGPSEGMAYLIDIGETLGKSQEEIVEEILHPERPPIHPELLWFRLKNASGQSARATISRNHASYDGLMTLCRIALSKDGWEKKSEISNGICSTCQARISGKTLAHPWPIDRSDLEENIRIGFSSLETLSDSSLSSLSPKLVVEDEVEFMNELSLGDPRLWLDKPPDGYPYRRTFVVGPSPAHLREVHRSYASSFAQMRTGRMMSRMADERSRSWAKHNERSLERARYGPGVRPPVPISVLQARPRIVSVFRKMIMILREEGFSVRPTPYHHLLGPISPFTYDQQVLQRRSKLRRKTNQRPVTLDLLFGGGMEGAFRAMVSYLP